MGKKEFILYAYSGPTDGTYTIDGKKIYVGKDFRTKDSYAKYAEAGFNVLLLQGNDPYTGEDWEKSQTKKNMDLAHNVGLKVIVYDKRINQLCNEKILIGIDSKFKSENELYIYLLNCVKDYKNHPAFYGLQLKDEPTYKYLDTIGKIYRLLKKILKDAFIQVNLLPMNLSAINSFPETKENDVVSRYKAYLNMFLDKSDADYILYDNYPFLNEDGNIYIRPDQIQTLYVASNLAKEKNINFYNIAQSCSMNLNGVSKNRKPSRQDMLWQINLLLAFGIKQIAYFTYFRKQINSTTDEFFPDDGSSFVAQNGKLNDMYFWVKDIHKRLSNFSDVINEFSFDGCMSLVSDKSVEKYAKVNNYDFDILNVKSINSGKGAFLTQLSRTKDFIYSVQNITDPETNGREDLLDIDLEIKKLENYEILLFSLDYDRQLSMNKNILNFKLESGEAVFVMLKNKGEKI